ncbi:MAG TPA: KOW domain-containing RNA-binding protein [Firmicutes bacterium]|nr:KOW domain-containing RNA-binding protein [Bacillota bacterium]
MDWKVGQLVISKQGRDRGHSYLIAETAEHYCLLVDGRKVTYEKPKKKNYKHLQGTLINSGSMAQKWAQGERISDREIRDFLNQYSLESGVKEVK